MIVFLIRTRLQCLIAARLVETIGQGQPYHAIFLYDKSRTEDAPAVYRHYQKFRRNAIGSTDIVSAEGLLHNIIRIFPLMFRSQLLGGCCYLSVVDSVPVAMALRMVPWLPLETFDDGFFNIQPGSRLYGMGPLPGGGLKRRLARAFFPNGSAEWMRTRSRRHHTIFPGRQNILPEDRVTNIDLDWSQLLEATDSNKIVPAVRSVILGTAHQDFPDPEASRKRADRLLENADLYIRHPRETRWNEHPKIQDFDSPAEAVLQELAKHSPLTVHHFNSTVAVTLSGHGAIDFINMVNDETRELAIETKG